MNTKIIKCDCNSKFQDDNYGVNMRVHNASLRENLWFGSKIINYKCSICGKEKNANETN